MRAEALIRVLTGGAAVVWALAALLALSFVSWWLVLLALLALVFGAPAMLRRQRMRRRLRIAGSGAPEAAAAGWREVLDASTDREVTLPANRSVRALAARLADKHGLDEAAKQKLRLIVTELERSWYAPASAGAARSDPGLEQAVREVLGALALAHPLRARDRFWPRSVLRRPVPAADRAEPNRTAPDQGTTSAG
ncbi:hypothetical protein [Sciscionella marina]|uniref:hypothetical protein n=1 Tax=Sciscionella marina TaxID=508770 RepID=UPI00039BDC41|nr:hypothetical protein [Sciscionella marina]